MRKKNLVMIALVAFLFVPPANGEIVAAVQATNSVAPSFPLIVEIETNGFVAVGEVVQQVPDFARVLDGVSAAEIETNGLVDEGYAGLEKSGYVARVGFIEATELSGRRDVLENVALASTIDQLRGDVEVPTVNNGSTRGRDAVDVTQRVWTVENVDSSRERTTPAAVNGRWWGVPGSLAEYTVDGDVATVADVLA